MKKNTKRAVTGTSPTVHRGCRRLTLAQGPVGQRREQRMASTGLWPTQALAWNWASHGPASPRAEANGAGGRRPPLLDAEPEPGAEAPASDVERWRGREELRARLGMDGSGLGASDLTTGTVRGTSGEGGGLQRRSTRRGRVELHL